MSTLLESGVTASINFRKIANGVQVSIIAPSKNQVLPGPAMAGGNEQIFAFEGDATTVAPKIADLLKELVTE
jgi:hypothetical protein